MTAARDYERHFGRPPRGIWLPECGYDPGVDEVLARGGHPLLLHRHARRSLHATPRPKFGVFAPILTRVGRRRLRARPRVLEAGLEREGGLSGRLRLPRVLPRRRLGPRVRLRPALPPLGRPPLEPRDQVLPDHRAGRPEGAVQLRLGAREGGGATRATSCSIARRQVEHLHGLLGRPPIIVAPYDAELFGHWWYEGPQWLEFLLRKIAFDQNTDRHDHALRVPRDASRPTRSRPRRCPRWGYKGYAEVWLNGVERLDLPPPAHGGGADGRAREPIRATPRRATDCAGRALRQAARELLLAQSSDWAFIMKTGTMVPYAEQRTREHVGNFTRLYHDLLSGHVDEAWLATVEQKNNVFPDLDYTVFADPR